MIARKRYGLLILFVLIVYVQDGCGLLFIKKGYYDIDTNTIISEDITAKIKIYMTKEEVKQLIGSPPAISTEQTENDVNEIWTYNQTSSEDLHFWLNMSAYTLGLWSFIPIGATEYFHILFSDGIVIGCDKSDRYPSDLIVDTLEC
jgi:hypothetical protein